MIFNFERVDLLTLLDKAPYKFYLGGSRRMAQRAVEQNAATIIEIDETTDYDFYADYSEQVLTWLVENGFTHTASSVGVQNGRDDYLDNEALAIVERDNVQIVLRKSADFYGKVFESIDPVFYRAYLWKSSPLIANREAIQPIFNALFAAAHAMENKDE